MLLVFTCRFKYIFITLKVDSLDDQKLCFILSLLVTYLGDLHTNVSVILNYSS